MPALEQENLAGDSADLLRERGVLEQLAVLAVHRNEIFRFNELEEYFHFLLAGVAGYVNRRVAPAFVIDQHAAAEKVVNHAEDRLFVAGNDARGITVSFWAMLMSR